MSIIINNSTLTDNKLAYNFYTTPLQSNSNSISQNIQLIANNDNNNYIKITNYPYNGKAAHITHDIFGASVAFTVTEMRIYKGVYNSADLQLIIETSSTKDEISYICIPLKRGNDNSSPNDLDKVIQSMCLNKPETCPEKINLNNLIIAPNTIYYVIKSDKQRIFNNSSTATNNNDKNVTIIVFDNEIKITGLTVDAAKNSIGSVTIGVDGGGKTSTGTSTGGYKSIQTKNITSPFNLSNSNIYIDCNGDASDGVTEVLGGTYKLTESDIKSIFFCFFIGSIFILFFYVTDKISNTVKILTKMYKKIHDAYDEDGKCKVPGTQINCMVGFIIFFFVLCFCLYTSSFLSKTKRVKLLISALYFTMLLFILIYVKFLRSVTTPPEEPE